MLRKIVVYPSDEILLLLFTIVVYYPSDVILLSFHFRCDTFVVFTFDVILLLLFTNLI